MHCENSTFLTVLHAHTLGLVHKLTLLLLLVTQGTSPTASTSPRLFQKRRMAAAVMQAARAESGAKDKKDGAANTVTSPPGNQERKTSWSRQTPTKMNTSFDATSTSSRDHHTTTPGMIGPQSPRSLSSTATPTSGSWRHAAESVTSPAPTTTTPSGMSAAVDDDDEIPDVRSLNRSRTGSQALPTSPFKKVVSSSHVVEAFSTARRARPPSLGQSGRAASMDTLLAARQRNGSGSDGEDLDNRKCTESEHRYKAM